MDNKDTAIKEDRLKLAKQLMTDFASRTGLIGEGGDINRRYLWTDAFAARTFFGLHQASGDISYKIMALKLIAQVHETLGRFSATDDREGWISGLSDQEGSNHPTVGGLRIGKRILERKAEELFDERLEWERDGQYFHYLTQWIYTLFRAEEETGEKNYSLWAIELTNAALDHFVNHQGSLINMYWKMSIDLSRPLVSHMGAHDPLDGFICAKLSEQAVSNNKVNLEKGLLYMTNLCYGNDWCTVDPLGIGELLLSAVQIAKMPASIELPKALQLEQLLYDIYKSLTIYTKSTELRKPAEQRLAFRECGLSLGLRCLKWIEKYTTSEVGLALLKSIAIFIPLADTIENFWSHPENQKSSTWIEHRDINTVMLASSLQPQGVLGNHKGRSL